MTTFDTNILNMGESPKTIEYTIKDSESTMCLFDTLHNIGVNNKISKLRQQIDECDDIQMRSHLSRKLLRTKEQLR